MAFVRERRVPVWKILDEKHPEKFNEIIKIGNRYYKRVGSIKDATQCSNLCCSFPNERDCEKWGSELPDMQIRFAGEKELYDFWNVKLTNQERKKIKNTLPKYRWITIGGSKVRISNILSRLGAGKGFLSQIIELEECGITISN